MTLNPRCLRNNTDGQDVFFCATGHLLPCCGLQRTRSEEEEKEVSRFYKNSMKVSNVERIEDIVEGEEWQSWFDTIINNPEQAPNICKRHCDDE